MANVERFKTSYSCLYSDRELEEVIEKAVKELGFCWDGEGSTGGVQSEHYTKFERKEKEMESSERREIFAQLCAERRQNTQVSIATKVIALLQDIGTPDGVIVDILEMLRKAQAIPPVTISERRCRSNAVVI